MLNDGWMDGKVDTTCCHMPHLSVNINPFFYAKGTFFVCLRILISELLWIDMMYTVFKDRFH